jgi:hypothetical protein
MKFFTASHAGLQTVLMASLTICGCSLQDFDYLQASLKLLDDNRSDASGVASDTGARATGTANSDNTVAEAPAPPGSASQDVNTKPGVGGGTGASASRTSDAGSAVLEAAGVRTVVEYDGSSPGGCGIDQNTDVNNCGHCGVKCGTGHAESTCEQGTCVLKCDSGWGDCDGNAANGCETSLLRDATRCGACENICNLSKATAACTNGVCTISTCQSGWGDCNGEPTDGCEGNLQTDSDHCGACSTACSRTGGTPSCGSGKCSIACGTGYADCDGDAANGCEVDLRISVSHCGSCPNACQLKADATPVCKSGTCGISDCAMPYGDCDGDPSNGCEVNENSDVDNCGGCGNRCAIPNATATCSAGMCGIRSCEGGYADCNAKLADGCETNLNTISNCGACGNVCPSTNGNPSCSNGTCLITCTTGYADCDRSLANGCEVNTQSDAKNCGRCANACTYGCASGECNTPCTGLCESPTIVALTGATSFNNLGTEAICYETTSRLAGGNCSNFAVGRPLYVNETAEVCGPVAWASMPAQRNGGYCIYAGAGAYWYATFTLW